MSLGETGSGAPRGGTTWNDVPRGVDAALAALPEVGRRAPRIGRGRTRELWELLATWAAVDLESARVLEPHLDALDILEQAGAPRDDGATRGVFAAEGPGVRLDARETPDGWRLSGVKPWCSLAGRLDAALVTAFTGDDRRRLFSVGLHHPGVTVVDGAWHSRGLAGIPSGPVEFADVPAEPVGADGWYLERPGFAWGGIGVAACWYGGAVGLARAVHAAAAQRPADVLLAMHLGAIDEALGDARRALAEAAADVDAGRAVGSRGRLLALRARATVARTGEEVLARTGHALGPAPLALDAEHAQRAADLTIYLRQHHAEKDLASLGTAVAEIDPW